MSKRKLLLADDSVTIQKVVSLTFADEGIEVISTGDGDSAMAKVAELKPDLVMADVNMPGLNGYQICEKIRNSEAISRTPVILLVGSFEPFDENEAKRVGADDFMTKPFQSIRQLVNKVTVLINSGGAVADLPVAAETAPPPENGWSDTSVAAPVAAEVSVPADTHAPVAAPAESEMSQASSASSPFAYYEASKFESREPKAEPAPVIFEPEPAPAAYAETATATAPEEEMPMPHAASILEADDDFLELPIFDDEEEEEILAPVPRQTEASVPEAAQAPALQSYTAPAGLAAQEAIEPEETRPQHVPSHFEEKGADMEVSPELVEAVSRRVVEKLSEKAVKDVAWEVVPEMAERIIKQMAEEKLKG